MIAAMQSALQSAAQADAGWPQTPGLDLWRGLVAVVVVASLLAIFVWSVRRGALGSIARSRRSGLVTVETAVSLGDRRSLVVVSVEGKRLLLGISPAQVSLLAELSAPAAFAEAMQRSIDADTGRTA